MRYPTELNEKLKFHKTPVYCASVSVSASAPFQLELDPVPYVQPNVVCRPLPLGCVLSGSKMKDW